MCCEDPFSGADHAVVVDTLCPGCGASPFKVAGTGRRIAPDDRAYEADAVALCCNRHVGVLRVETNTLFGLREDEAVLRSGVRIY
jgi:hypothetical protein